MTVEFQKISKFLRGTAPIVDEPPDFNKIYNEEGEEAMILAARDHKKNLQETGQIHKIADTLELVALACEEAGIKELPEEWQDFIIDILTQPEEPIETITEQPGKKQIVISKLLEKHPHGGFVHTSPEIATLLIEKNLETNERTATKFIQNTSLNFRNSLFSFAAEHKNLKTSGEVLTEAVKDYSRIISSTKEACLLILNADPKYENLPLPVLVNHIFATKDRTTNKPRGINTDELVNTLGITKPTINQVTSNELVLGLDYYLAGKELLFTPQGQLLIQIAAGKTKRLGIQSLTKAINEVQREEITFYHLLQNFEPTPELDFLLASFFRHPKTQKLIQLLPYFNKVNDMFKNYTYPGKNSFNNAVVRKTIPQFESLFKLVICSLKFKKQDLLIQALSSIETGIQSLGIDTLSNFLQTTNLLPENQEINANKGLLHHANIFITDHKKSFR